MSNKNQTKTLAYNAIIIAITVLVGVIPQIGFIQIPGIPAITIMHIPVIIAATALGFYSGILASLTFGVTSMLVAMTRGLGFDILFMNPVVSILPRLAFGIFAGILFSLLKSTKMNDNLKVGVTAFVSSLFHSLVTLVIMYFVMGFSDIGEFLEFYRAGLWFVLSISFVGAFLEAVAAVLISIPVVAALRRVIR